MFGKMPAPRRLTVRPMVVVLLLFLSSLAIRTTLDLDMALATQFTGNEQAAADAACAPAPDIAGLLEQIKLTQNRQDATEVRLEDRLAALRIVEAEVKQDLAALEAAENRLKASIGVATTAAEDDLARLVAVYENMDRKVGAALFEAMSPEFAAGFLGRMNPESAAGLMSQLSPEFGYAVSLIIAGRNADVGR